MSLALNRIAELEALNRKLSVENRRLRERLGGGIAFEVTRERRRSYPRAPGQRGRSVGLCECCGAEGPIHAKGLCQQCYGRQRMRRIRARKVTR
jgi:hypothetical protein